MKSLLIACSALALASCSVLPSVGPSADNVYASSRYAEGDSHIVTVTRALAEGLRVPSGYGFPSSFMNSGTANYESIRPGDLMTVTVWENVDNGVFASLGSRVTQLQPMRVSADGYVFMPYVGRLKAAGKSPDQLRRQITASLASQTPEPQVEVSREAGQSGGVKIFNTNGGGGLVPFNEGNLNLASMLAQAGGLPSDPKSTTITVTRGRTSGTILAQDLFDNPSYDIPLRNNDRITIEPDRRSYRILGSGGAQSLVQFDRPDLTALDAISQTGGLNSSISDPSGVFVLRTVSAPEASLLLRDQEYYAPQQFIFVLNLREPDGLFIADKFQLRDGDTIYITEAPFVTWTKVISAIAQTAGSIDSLQNIGTSLVN